MPAFMEEFYRKQGNTKLRFKPAYNPYTEVGFLMVSWIELLMREAEYGGLLMA